MFEFLQAHQLDIMQALSGVCGLIAVLLFMTKALSVRRRRNIILMQFAAMFLLIFDRMAYMYSGTLSRTGYIMVRFSNLMVFFLTPAIVLIFNLYLIDLLTDEGGLEEAPRRLRLVTILAVVAMFLAVIAHFTGLYYTFDVFNMYHRAPGFIICYIIPIVGPVIQFSVVINYRRRFSRIIFISLILFLVVPVIAAIIQVFAYGISITNMMMVLVSVMLYVFAYFDINDAVNRAHEIELEHLKRDTNAMKHLFDQMATSFIGALEERDPYSKGHSGRVADYAVKVAKSTGMTEKECEEVYYAALLHDIGKITLSDEILLKGDDLSDEEKDTFKGKQLAGARILEQISEYPTLSYGARYVKERYDGTGYPQGLKGEDIPKIARVVAVADAYDRMIARDSYNDPLPPPIIREEFITGAGTRFDPVYAQAILRLIDVNAFGNLYEDNAHTEEGYTSELTCGTYRDNISRGILIEETTTVTEFKVDKPDETVTFSAPSLIVFDSYDARVHRTARSIGAYNYKEYGELWFDGRYVCTEARNMEVEAEGNEDAGDAETADSAYRITTVRSGDHLRIRLEGPTHRVEAVIALTNGSSWAYVGITGENCHIHDVTVDKTRDRIGDGEIGRISDEVSYIDRIESDLPNIQINGTRSASTAGVPVRDGLKLAFHTMSLPMANLVWQCPYIILFTSEDGKVNGPGYRELAFVKLNGEDNGSNEYAQNNFVMKRDEEFAGWDEWKRLNKQGLECEVDFLCRGKKITFTTSNFGISIQNTTTPADIQDRIYVALSGDEVALTDIRVIV